jgi:hypothetical protein
MFSGSPAVQLGSSRREPAPLAQGAPWYKRFWRRYRQATRALGTLLSRIVITVVYMVAVTPFAAGIRLFADPLALKRRPVNWTPIPPPSGIDEARRGF